MASRTQQLGTRRAGEVTNNTVASKKPRLQPQQSNRSAGKSSTKKPVANRGRGRGRGKGRRGGHQRSPSSDERGDAYEDLGIVCCLSHGKVADEEGFTFKDEEDNRTASAEMHNKVYLRVMNGWAFVNKDNNLVVPERLNLEDSGVFLLGWATSLSGGQRRVQRIMTGYWPPKENEEGPGHVWRMHSAVLKVKVRDIFFEDVPHKIVNFRGIWVSSQDAHYLLQSPVTEYASKWTRANRLFGFERFKWKDIPPEDPLPNWMEPWTRAMFRMEFGYPVTHRQDPAYSKNPADPILGESDAESIPDDDENPLPTGTKWRGGDPYGESPTWNAAASSRIGGDAGDSTTPEGVPRSPPHTGGDKDTPPTPPATDSTTGQDPGPSAPENIPHPLTPAGGNENPPPPPPRTDSTTGQDPGPSAPENIPRPLTQAEGGENPLPTPPGTAPTTGQDPGPGVPDDIPRPSSPALGDKDAPPTPLATGSTTDQGPSTSTTAEPSAPPPPKGDSGVTTLTTSKGSAGDEGEPQTVPPRPAPGVLKPPSRNPHAVRRL